MCEYQEDCSMAVSTKCAGLVKDKVQLDNENRKCRLSTECGTDITVNKVKYTAVCDGFNGAECNDLDKDSCNTELLDNFCVALAKDGKMIRRACEQET